MKFIIKVVDAIKINGRGTNDRSVWGIVFTSNKPGVFGKPTDGGKAAAKIVLGDYGFIDFYNISFEHQSNTSSLNHNFYNSSGSKETMSGLTKKTYAWDASLNSSNGGWKAEG